MAERGRLFVNRRVQHTPNPSGVKAGALRHRDRVRNRAIDQRYTAKFGMFMEKRVQTYAISKVKRDSVSLVASSRI